MAPPPPVPLLLAPLPLVPPPQLFRAPLKSSLLREVRDPSQSVTLAQRLFVGPMCNLKLLSQMQTKAPRKGEGEFFESTFFIKVDSTSTFEEIIFFRS